MALEKYREKRRFEETPEPRGAKPQAKGHHFVVQEHHATRLHYDFRLEVNGVLASWAVPKGPSMDPADKRLAMHVEDHPLEYAKFEGSIPEGNYGAGEVIVWDEGTYEPEGSMPAREQIEKGELKFTLRGQKLKGSFVLVKMRGGYKGRSSRGNEWLLIKHRDQFAETGWSASDHAESVISGRTIEQSEAVKDKPTWKSSRPATQRNSRFEKARERKAALNTTKVEFPRGAKAAPMPDRITPALATLADKPFSDPNWLFEIKWDGLRALSRVEKGQLQLWTRSQREVTREYPDLAEIPDHARGHDVWLDGEVVSLDSEGRSDFQKLQQRFSVLSPTRELMGKAPVVYYVFDLLYCDGHDLREVPLIERKKLLKQILQTDDQVRYSDHEVERGQELYEEAAKQNLEGIIAKQIHSSYPEGRSRSWLKFKTVRDLDAVVGGWTEGRKSREHFGALLVGLYDGKGLEFIGGVGTGFTVAVQAKLAKQLEALATDRRPFAQDPHTKEKAYWVKPEMVVRVGYANWTGDRHLRAPRYLGTVEDRDPKECTFAKEENVVHTKSQEEPAHSSRDKGDAAMKVSNGAGTKAKAAKWAAAKKVTAGASGVPELAEQLGDRDAKQVAAEIEGKPLTLTNLDKIYFPKDGYTKRDLLTYYLTMAPYILPFLKDRPMVLRRYPNGIASKAFFQKDAGEHIPDWIATAKIESDSKGETIRYFLCNDTASLLYLTNLGCIDHNPWSSRYNDQEHPDYIFFDLDPSDDTPFAETVSLAKDLAEKLDEIALRAFVKTSGASGIHIFIPIQPRYTYEQVRQFVEVVAAWSAREHHKLITTQRSLNKRPKKSIYVDAHQNSRGQSLASVYSVRAFDHAPVSTPVAVKELTASLKPAKWNLKTVPGRVEEVGDLWGDFWQSRQELEPAVKKLEKKL